MTTIFLRSLLYNVLFYAWLVALILIALPTFLLPRAALLAVVRFWARSSIWLLRMVCGTSVEYRGVEKIPTGPLIVASKHQSMWETFALTQFFDQPLYILKRELLWIPFFGWYLRKAGMIGIDRASGGKSLLEMVRRARDAVKGGRQLIIFPEGTRTAVDAPPQYKNGVGLIYAGCNAPCIPVALNSGLFWPRRQFLRRPGTIVVEYLPPIPPGLDRRRFMAELETAIETATDRLVAEAQAGG